MNYSYLILIEVILFILFVLIIIVFNTNYKTYFNSYKKSYFTNFKHTFEYILRYIYLSPDEIEIKINNCISELNKIEEQITFLTDQKKDFENGINDYKTKIPQKQQEIQELKLKIAQDYSS